MHLNLHTGFWALFRPRRDITVNCFKACLTFLPLHVYIAAESSLESEKTPNPDSKTFFLHIVKVPPGTLRPPTPPYSLMLSANAKNGDLVPLNELEGDFH